MNEDCRQVIQQLGLDNDVYMLGTRADARELMNDMDIVTMFSKWEGLPIVLIEAMFAGKPVISSQVGGIPEIIDHGTNGYMITDLNIHQGADYICLLLDDKDLRTRMGEAGRKRQQNIFPRTGWWQPMTGSTGKPNPLDKRKIYVFIMAGIVAGLSPVLMGIDRLYIPVLAGTCVLAGLLVYKYHWVVVLNTLLLSVVFFEPAPCDMLFVPLFIFGIAGDYIELAKLQGCKVVVLSFILFAILNTLQLFYITDMEAGIRYYVITLYLIIFCLYLFMYVSRKNMKGLLMAYIVSGTLSALLGVSAHIGVFPSLLMYDQYRIKAFFKDPNVLGPFLVPAVLMLLDDMRGKRLIRYPVWVHTILIIINLLGIIASFSRGAWLNLAVCILLYFALNIRKIDYKSVNYKRLLIYAAIVAVAGFLIWNYGLSHEMKNFILSRLGLQLYDTDRFAVQNAGIRLALLNPLGYGPGQFEYAVMDQTGVHFSAHNFFIRLSVENGVAGFGIFISSLVYIFYRLILDFRRERSYAVLTPAALLAILAGTMINSMVIDTLHWRHLWFFIGVSMANIFPEKGEGSGNTGV